MAQAPLSPALDICSTLPEETPLWPVLRQIHIEAAVLDRLRATRWCGESYSDISPEDSSKSIRRQAPHIRHSESVDAVRAAGIYWRYVLVPEAGAS
jgi:hypothetical protein